MPEKIEFNLIQVKLLKHNLPKGKDIDEKKVMWYFSFSISFNRLSQGKQGVKIVFGYKLYYKDDPEKKTIASIEIESKFWVMGKVSPDGKLHTLYRLLSIVCWNLQGAHAAKTEGTPLASVIPGAPKFEQYEEKIKKDITNGWRL